MVSKVKAYELSDILAYMSCPQKYYLSQKYGREIHDGDSRLAIATALKETYLQYFNTVGGRRAWSVNRLSKFFATKWHEYKEKYNIHSYDLNQIIKANEKILSIESFLPRDSQVAMVNYPIERSFRECTIKDKLDLILVCPNDTIQLFYFSTSNTAANEVNYLDNIRHRVWTSGFRRELGYTGSKIVVKEFNTYRLYRREIKSTSVHKVNYPRIIQSVVKHIEGKAYYPHADLNKCKACIYRDKCPWSL